jgi:hypothetical protein
MDKVTTVEATVVNEYTIHQPDVQYSDIYSIEGSSPEDAMLRFMSHGHHLMIGDPNHPWEVRN